MKKATYHRFDGSNWGEKKKKTKKELKEREKQRHNRKEAARKNSMFI